MKINILWYVWFVKCLFWSRYIKQDWIKFKNNILIAVLLVCYLMKLYITEILNLCKFRCGNHNLTVADGRYLPWYIPKLCTIWNIQEPGDEFHYMFVCPAHANIPRSYRVRPNILKFNQLFDVKHKMFNNSQNLINLSNI